MLELWNPITLFRRGRTDIRLSVPDGLESHGSIRDAAFLWDAAKQEIDVKPNPLFLVVKVGDNGDLSLNNEPEGSLSNTKVLSDKLKGHLPRARGKRCLSRWNERDRKVRHHPNADE